MANALYVTTVMIACYCLEIFYQIKKRRQNFLIAQFMERTDFTLFLVASYVLGQPEIKALLLAFLFYLYSPSASGS